MFLKEHSVTSEFFYNEMFLQEHWEIFAQSFGVWVQE